MSAAASSTQHVIAWCVAHALPPPVLEYRFALTRRWRFDVAWPARRVALEVEGGIWTGASRHTRGTGFLADIEKYNTATSLGWRVLRATPQTLYTPQTLDWLRATFALDTPR